MAERDDPHPSSELEEEGIPDHVGPLPGKAMTGDQQEGLSPPRDRPVASEDLGTTAEEQREGESLDERLAREEPDLDQGDVGAEPTRGEGRRTGRLVEPTAQGAGRDMEKDEIGDEWGEDTSGYSDEERAVRMRETG